MKRIGISILLLVLGGSFSAPLGLAGETTKGEADKESSKAHGLRTAKDLPKPLPEAVEAVNKTAVAAGKELSKAGQVVKDAANKAYKNIKNGTSK